MTDTIAYERAMATSATAVYPRDFHAFFIFASSHSAVKSKYATQSADPTTAKGRITRIKRSWIMTRIALIPSAPCPVGRSILLGGRPILVISSLPITADTEWIPKKTLARNTEKTWDTIAKVFVLFCCIIYEVTRILETRLTKRYAPPAIKTPISAKIIIFLDFKIKLSISFWCFL